MNDGSTNELLDETAKLLGKLRDKLLELNVSPISPPQTVGQRIAERMVHADEAGGKMRVYEPIFGPQFPLFLAGTADTAACLRRIIARAIDKAIADDRAAADDINAAGIAAEREACAKIADQLLLCIECDGRTEQAIKAVKRGIANHIRARQ